MVIEDRIYELELDPGWTAIAEPLDAATTQALRRMFTDVLPDRAAVQVAPAESPDVTGHAFADTIVDVLVTIGDDVSGHAFSLRFPSPEDAQRMRTRLAAGGLLVAALTIGSIAVGTQVGAPPQAGTGAGAQAVPAAAAPFVDRGLNADIRSGDIVFEEAAPAARFVDRGLNADIRSGDIVEEEAGSTPVIHGPQKN